MTRNLETPRLLLRPIGADDADLLFRLHRDAEAARMMPFVLHASIDESRELLRRILERNASGASCGWVVQLRDGAAIGDVALVRIDDVKRQADIGYHLLREHWGAGGLARVVASIDDSNVRSRRLAEKLGFVLERTFDELIDGASRTTHVYARESP